MVDELSQEIYERIQDLSAKGDALAEDGEYTKAIELFEKALSLLPKPITRWTAATWLLSAIGDTYYLSDDYEKATKAFQQALLCPDGIGNPFIHLRLGQSQYELGNLEYALDELVRAYMGAGEELFDEQDPKYLKLVKSSLRPPADEDIS